MRWGHTRAVLLLAIAILLVSSLIQAAPPAGRQDSFARQEPLEIAPEIAQQLEQDGTVRVIVTLKEPAALSKEERKALQRLAKDAKGERNAVRERAMQKTKSPKHHFDSFNGFSAQLDAQELESLRLDSTVASIAYDRPVRKTLADTVTIVNATGAWRLQPAGANLTGVGRTVCVIDTGVDYTHPSLGGCSPTPTGQHRVDPIAVSSLGYPADYSPDLSVTTTITKAGYSRVAVFFTDLHIEEDYDYVVIYDGNDNYVAHYTGNRSNFWSASVPGDRIKIAFYTDETDEGGPYRGFSINATKNASTASMMDWSACTKVVAGHDFVNSDSDPMDDDGHGTHVAGIIAGNGSVRGVAPDARLIAVKVLDADGNGFDSDVVAGIEYCASLSSSHNLSAISMSLGGGSYAGSCDASEPASASAINAAVARNITVVVASGNDGYLSNISAPACISAAIPVGATTKADAMAGYSNRNALVQLVAPGSSVVSALLGGGTASASGTSMATPHVAGAVALLDQFAAQQGRKRTPSQIRSALNSTGTPVFDAGSSLTFRRINAYAAGLALDDEPPRVAIMSPMTAQRNATPVINVTVNGTWTPVLWVNITAGSYVYHYNASANTANCTAAAQPNSVVCTLIAGVLPDGNTTLAVTARDVAGNSNSTSATFLVDTAPPVIVASSANRSIARTNTAVFITLNITEANLANATAGDQALSCVGGAESKTCTGVIALTSTSILLQVNDLAGNAANSTLNFTIDDVSPAVTIAPQDAGSTSSRAISFNVSDGAGIDLTTLSVRGVAGFNSSGCTSNATAISCAFNATNLSQGQNSMHVTAYDAADNLLDAAVTFTYDTSGPLISANISPTTNSTRPAISINLSYAITDAHSAIASVWYVLDGTTTALLNGSQNTTMLTNLSMGQHSLILYANDSLGNNGSRDVGVFYALAPVNVSEIISGVRRGDAADAAFYIDGDRVTGGLRYLNRTLRQEIVANSSVAGMNISINITILGSNMVVANASVPVLTTNRTAPAPASVAAVFGSAFSAVALYQNMSRFIADDAYTDESGTPQWVHVRFGTALGTDRVVYIADDAGATITVLPQCPGNVAPSPPAASPGCYVSGSAVDVYIPHFSGAGLLSAASAPSYLLTSPGSSVNDSKLAAAGFIYDLDLNTSSCLFNLTLGDALVVNTTAFTPTLAQGSTNYSFSVGAQSGLWNLTGGQSYNVTVGCASLDGNRSSQRAEFLVNDTTAPSVVVSVSASATGATITLAGSYEEFNYTLNGSAASASGAFGASHIVQASGLSASTTYSYEVLVCDRVGNCATQGPSTFTTAAAPSGASSGGGGGGGGGAGGPAVLSSTAIRKTLSVGGAFSFSIPNSTATFSLAIKSLAPDTVTVVVQSVSPPLSIAASLAPNQSKSLDLNADASDDATITLVSSTNRTATFTISTARTPSPSPDVAVPSGPDARPQTDELLSGGAQVNASELSGTILIPLNQSLPENATQAAAESYAQEPSPSKWIVLSILIVAVAALSILSIFYLRTRKLDVGRKDKKEK